MTPNVSATVALGQRLGTLATPGTCILLHGALGAGKTQLARGIAQGAHIADLGLVSSPTYVLMNVYPAAANDPDAKTVYHLDAYRANGPEDFATIDLSELLGTPPSPQPFHAEAPAPDASPYPAGIVVIEWPERIADLLPEDRLEIFIEPVDEEHGRRLELTATGPHSTDLLQRYQSP